MSDALRILFDVETGNEGKRGLGDILLTKPVIRAIKNQHHNCQLDYLAREEVHVLLEDEPGINELLTEANADDYDIYFALGQELEDYTVERNRQPRIDAIAEICNVELFDRRLSIHSIKRIPKAHALGISIESTSPYRKWRSDYLLELIDGLKKDFEIHVFGTEQSAKLSAQLPGYVVNHIGQTSIKELMQWILQMRLFFCCDSFISHLTAMYNIPAIVLYTEVSAEWRCNYYPTVTGIQAPCKCSPCLSFYNETKEIIDKCHIAVETENGYPNCITSYTPDMAERDIRALASEHNVSNARILVRTLDGLGDVITSIPLAKCLSLWGYTVDYQVRDEYVKVLQGLKCIRNINKEETEYTYIINSTQKLSDYLYNRTDALFDFAHVHGDNGNRTPELQIGWQEKMWANRHLHLRKQNIVISPAGTFQSRTYPLHNLIELIKQLDDNNKHVILVHNNPISFEHEQEYDLTNLTGQLSIRQLMAIIHEANATITVDTATMHIAGALKKPFVLLVSTIPSEWVLKYYPTGVSIKSDMECSPCKEKYSYPGCSKVNYLSSKFAKPYMPCMNALKPENIITKLEEVLTRWSS